MHLPDLDKNKKTYIMTVKLFPGTEDDLLNENQLDKSFPIQKRFCSPAVNVIGKSNEFVIEVAAPGIAKEEFDLKIEKEQLIISVQKAKTEKQNEETILRQEFCFNSFSRRFDLPANVDSEKVSASYKKGILSIVVPKKEEETDSSKEETVE